jgi:hypothetical protein
MPVKNLDKENQSNYFSTLFGSINIEDFIEDEGHKSRLRRAAPLDIPDVIPAGAPPPPAGGLEGAPPPVAGPAAGAPPPVIGDPVGINAPPVAAIGGAPAPIVPDIDLGLGQAPLPKDTSEYDEKVQDLLSNISDLKGTIEELKNDVRYKKLEEYVYNNVEELKKTITDLRDRKIPVRDAYDTEGVYRDRLYGLVTEVLDKILPDLLEEIPEYSFLASQVSRQFDDGTVADALVSVNVTVAREGNRYDFKIEVPILNGLIQYPSYIYRGLRIIPLVKEQIQRELNSFSYRKMDVDTPFEKENLFSNIGENINRRQDNQKQYSAPLTRVNNNELPPDHTWHPKQKQTYR